MLARTAALCCVPHLRTVVSIVDTTALARICWFSFFLFFLNSSTVVCLCVLWLVFVLSYRPNTVADMYFLSVVVRSVVSARAFEWLVMHGCEMIYCVEWGVNMLLTHDPLIHSCVS